MTFSHRNGLVRRSPAQLLFKMSVEPLQGALPWLRRLNANKIACAVVSTVRRVLPRRSRARQ